jgi:hypothetical protein
MYVLGLFFYILQAQFFLGSSQSHYFNVTMERNQTDVEDVDMIILEDSF